MSRIGHRLINNDKASKQVITIEDEHSIDENDRLILDKLHQIDETTPKSVAQEDLAPIQEDHADIDVRSHDGCSHINIGPVRLRTVKGKKGFWHSCRDCKELIKPISRKSRDDYNQASVPNGVNMRTHEAEDRRRD